MAVQNWKAQEPAKSLNGIVAVPAVYEFELAAGAWLKLEWPNLTRSIQIVADGALGLAYAYQGNEFPIAADAPFSEVLQTNRIYLHNAGGEAVAGAAHVVLSDMVVTGTDPAFELSGARGFDGIDGDEALTNPYTEE